MPDATLTVLRWLRDRLGDLTNALRDLTMHVAWLVERAERDTRYQGANRG